MKNAVISLLLIALCISIILTLPPLRKEARELAALAERGRLAPTQVELEQAARQLPPKPALEIALAQFAMSKALGEMDTAEEFGPPQLPADLSAFQKAVENFPDAPEAHLHLAIQLLQRAGHFQWPESWRGVGVPPVVRKVNRTEEQTANLEKAINQLRQAAMLAPQNAAPDYLLSLALSANGDESGAKASLSAALSKPGWSLYAKEIRSALAELCQQAKVPEIYYTFIVPSIGPTVFSSVYSHFGVLGRLLVGRAEMARAAGNNGEALFYTQALLHLGKIMLDNADALVDGQSATAITLLTREPFLSQEQIAKLRQQTAEKANEQIAELQGRNLQNFLVSRGREDLAELYADNWKRILTFQANAVNAGKDSADKMVQNITAPIVFFALASLAQATVVLLLLVLVLVLSLVFSGSRGIGPPPVWRWWQGGLLILLTFGASYLAVFFALAPGEATFASLSQGKIGSAQAWAIRGVFLAPIIFLMVSLIWGIRKRPLAAKERIGKFHAGLVSWRSLLLPSLAILLVAALGFNFLAQRQLQPWLTELNDIIQQGVVPYYKLIPPK